MGLLEALLVHPPIFDFTAYDFWLRPYGMMRAAARLSDACRFTFFDYLTTAKKDSWGRGRIEGEIVAKPEAFSDIPRRFRRFGRPRAEFQELLRSRAFDAALIQTSMTYWYPGVREVIEDIRALQPAVKIVLGGVYATLCTEHAAFLGADLVIQGANLNPLYELLAMEPPRKKVPVYMPEENAAVGVLKLSDGCPFQCTYCAAPMMWNGFAPRGLDECVEDFRRLVAAGAKDIAFYDDALLYRADEMLLPFLDAVGAGIDGSRPVRFHTPNALNARFITPDLARRMVKAGFASFFLGFESGAQAWQTSTGGKVSAGEFEAAVNYLREAGASAIFAYILAGHPDADAQDPENSIRLAHRLGVRVMLSEFSPIPGTADGEKCAPWADLADPLSHNKTAFALRRLGSDRLNRLKELARGDSRRNIQN
jgi:radical SAM superfamily enzyme YgiQ (UPF0313 family)